MRLMAPVLALLLAAPVAADKPTSDAAKRKRMQELYRGYRKELAPFPELTVPELLARRKRGETLVLVDAREPREQRVSMIPGAVPAGMVVKHPGRYRGRIVVAYCTIGYRSARLVKRLRKQGITAFNLAGSLLAWAHHGQPLVDGKGRPTRRLHVYGKTWDLAPRGYRTVW